MAFEPLKEDEDLLQVEKEEDHFFQQTFLHDVDDGKESLKDSSILEEEHVNMHEVAPQSMHTIVVEKEDSNEEIFWDELEVFYLSPDNKQSALLASNLIGFKISNN